VRPQDFDPRRLTVFGRGRDGVFASVPDLLLRLNGQRSPSSTCSADRLAALRRLAAGLHDAIGELFASVQETRRSAADRSASRRKSTDPRLIALAERCCDLHAAAACLGLWLYNRDYLDEAFAEGAWLASALARPVLHRFETGQLTPLATTQLIDRLRLQQEGNHFFSVLPIRQAAYGSVEQRRHSDSSIPIER
jgi:hypothetical protein